MVTFTTTMPSTVLTGTSTVSTSSTETNANNNESADSVVPLLVDVTTVIDLPASATPGSVITVTVTSVNSGTATTPAQNVTTTVTLSDGTTRTITVGTLAPGASTVTTFTTTMPAGTLTGTSTIATTSTDVNPANNQSVDRVAPLLVDVTTTIDLPASAAPGSVITVTVTSANSGTATTPAQNVTMTVILSNGATQTIVVGTLAAGGSSVATFTTTMPSVTLTGTSTVATTNVETNITNNSSTDTVGVLVVDVTTTVDLPPNAAAGSVITVTVTTANSGTATTPAQNVTTTVTLSDGTTRTIPVGTLAPGASTVTTFTTTMPATTLTGTSTVITTSADANTTNNVSTDIVLPLIVDVRVLISGPTTTVTLGTPVIVTVTFSNEGAFDASNVTGTVSLPNGSVLSVLNVPVLAAKSSVTVTVTYVPPQSQGTNVLITATVATTTPETTLSNNIATVSIVVPAQRNAAISGRVWFDVDRDRTYDAPTPGALGGDVPLPNYRVEVLDARGEIAGTATTGPNGTYTVSGLLPGANYSVRFRNTVDGVIFGTPFNQAALTERGNPSTGVSTTTSSINAIGIRQVTLYNADIVVEQNLPLDPNGTVYDSVTRNPIGNATVTLYAPNGAGGWQLATPYLLNLNTGGNPANYQTGADGLYQFFVDPAKNPPTGTWLFVVTADGYRSVTPGGFDSSAGRTLSFAVNGGVATPGAGRPNDAILLPDDPRAGRCVANFIDRCEVSRFVSSPPVGANGADTNYVLKLVYSTFANAAPELFHNHIPMDRIDSRVDGRVLVTKAVDRSVVELGESVKYTISVRNTAETATLRGVVLQDVMPPGINLIPGTIRVSKLGQTSTLNVTMIGRSIELPVGTLAPNEIASVTYFARVAVGSQAGDGINRVHAVFNDPASGAPLKSNTAQAKVTVQGGVLSNEGCVIGKVYVDCNGNGNGSGAGNGNHLQGNAGGSNDLGIPGVRIVGLDGNFVITDSEGKYSVCGLPSRTHVFKLDRTTLPKGSRMTPSSNRNAGDGSSIFVDLRGGELHRADFIEGSCTKDVLDQVKARRAAGAVAAPETEKQMDFRIENQAPRPVQQILPAPRPSSGNGGVQ
jgi:uncharacterized repeat protein (TIGR01451 family)